MPLGRKGQCVHCRRSLDMADHRRGRDPVAVLGLDLGRCLGLVDHQLVAADLLGRLAVAGFLDCHHLGLETVLVVLVPGLDQMQNRIDSAVDLGQIGFGRLVVGYLVGLAADLGFAVRYLLVAVAACRCLGMTGRQTGTDRSGCP